MESKLRLGILLGLGLFIFGCSAGEGPNDPVVDGKSLTQAREKNMSDKDKAISHPVDPMASGPR